MRGSPSFECFFGSIEESNTDWESVSSIEWDCEAKEEKGSQCSDLQNEDSEKKSVLIQCVRNLRFCETYANRRPDLSPPCNCAWAQAQN